MTGEPRIHEEVLPPLPMGVLRALAAPIRDRGFYLAGGTGLALQLGHRRSLDFDWFSTQPVVDPMNLAASLRKDLLQVESTDPGTLHTRLQGVRVTFLSHPYPLLQPPVRWDPPGVDIASLQDISTMKLAAVVQRGSRKDFVDLHALDRSGVDLESMLRWYRERYQIRDVAHVLAALSYFDDAEREPMPAMLWDAGWEEIKRSIQA